MSIDLDYLSKTYFWFDLPVEYKLKNKNVIKIYPISVKDSEMFLSWVDILTIDKNSLPNPEYISMSYLEFIVKTLITSEDENVAHTSTSKLVFILKLCLGWGEDINIRINDIGKPVLAHGEIEINGKSFEDIRRIILYQNILDFDDSYINPDVKQAMAEVDEVKSKNLVFPTLERKFAIISSHSGITKSQQLEMTYRSHSALFKEVCNEVEFVSARTGVMVGNMFSKQKIDFDDWVYKKKRSKYEDYFTTQDSYSKSMGGTVRPTVEFDGNMLNNLEINSFIN